MDETITWETIRGDESRLCELHASATAMKTHCPQLSDDESQRIISEAIGALYDLNEGRQMQLETFLGPIIGLSDLLGRTKQLPRAREALSLLISDLLHEFPDAYLERRGEWVAKATTAQA